MKAMIFAAGLGTRLRPLTNDRPKALVEVGGRPLLEIALRRLRFFGFRQVVINIHHFADAIRDFLAQNDNFGLDIRLSDETDRLLDTGGGLKKAAPFFDDGAPFLLCNADILTSLHLKELYDFHVRHGGVATLAVRQRPTSRYLLFRPDTLQLCGWKNEKTGEIRRARLAENPVPLAFSGVQVVSPEIFEWMPDRAVFSIIEVYLAAAAQRPVFGFRHDADHWLDVGKPEK
ncbi:MAG: nucleotidyltransferase family protein, partial [Bacteroidetes bacterium]